MTLNPLNQKRLSPTFRIQSRPRLLNVAFHHGNHPNSTTRHVWKNPRTLRANFTQTIAWLAHRRVPQAA